MNHQMKSFIPSWSEWLFLIQGGIHTEENRKKMPAKRIQLVDVVLERKGSQLFSGRRVGCVQQSDFRGSVP